MRLFQAQSHTLTALVTLLVHELELHGTDELFQRQLDAVGFLIHFERCVWRAPLGAWCGASRRVWSLAPGVGLTAGCGGVRLCSVWRGHASLLSTIGDERGMLEDYYAGIRELSTVRVRFAEAAAPHELGGTATPHGLHVERCACTCA